MTLHEQFQQLLDQVFIRLPHKNILNLVLANDEITYSYSHDGITWYDKSITWDELEQAIDWYSLAREYLNIDEYPIYFLETKDSVVLGFKDFKRELKKEDLL